MCQLGSHGRLVIGGGRCPFVVYIQYTTRSILIDCITPTYLEKEAGVCVAAPGEEGLDDGIEPQETILMGNEPLGDRLDVGLGQISWSVWFSTYGRVHVRLNSNGTHEASSRGWRVFRWMHSSKSSKASLTSRW